MRILRLAAENILRLVAVEISPDGNLVKITGKNGAGKSAVLNTIWLGLGGGEAQRQLPEPIRHGQEQWGDRDRAGRFHRPARVQERSALEAGDHRS